MSAGADLAYESLRQVTPFAGVVLAANPSRDDPGRHQHLAAARRAGRRQAVVVDPGPPDEQHLAAVLEAAGSVPLILLTHGHADHAEGARRLHELTGGAGVRPGPGAPLRLRRGRRGSGPGRRRSADPGLDDARSYL